MQIDQFSRQLAPQASLIGGFCGNTIEIKTTIVSLIIDSRSEKKDRAEEVVDEGVVKKEKNKKSEGEKMRKNKKRHGEDTHLES